MLRAGRWQLCRSLIRLGSVRCRWGTKSVMDIIRHEDGSLTVPVVPDRHATDDTADGAVAIETETRTLHPGEGGYTDALAAWDLQQDPSRGVPVSTAAGRTRRWQSFMPWPRIPSM